MKFLIITLIALLTSVACKDEEAPAQSQTNEATIPEEEACSCDFYKLCSFI